MGWIVIRVWGHSVEQDLDAVTKAVASQVLKKAPTGRLIHFGQASHFCVSRKHRYSQPG